MRRNLTAAIWILILGLPTVAAAQSSDDARRSTLDPGRMEIGLNLAGVYSSATVTPDKGDEATQTTLYLNPSLFYGLTVTENVQARLLVGYQGIETSIGDLTTQDSGTTTIVAQGLYHIPLQQSFAFYTGGGLGGYFGTAERNTGSDGLKFESDTSGAMFQFLLGILSQPSDRINLRAGLRFDAQFGSETPKDDAIKAASGDSSIQNLQGLLEISAGLRFGEAW